MLKLSTVLIILGFVILILSGFLVWRINDPARLQFSNVELKKLEKPYLKPTPTTLVYRDLSLKLPIIPANKTGNFWETTSKGVSYLVTTPEPGETGNSIMYGHNWGSILGNLNKAAPGQILEIYFSDGDRKEFKVKYVQEVNQDNGSVLKETTDKRITLYTCSGLFDQKRLVVIATLI